MFFYFATGQCFSTPQGATKMYHLVGKRTVPAPQWHAYLSTPEQNKIIFLANTRGTVRFNIFVAPWERKMLL